METGRAWSLVVDTHAASTPNTTPELIFHGCMLLLVKTIHVRHCLRLNHPAAGMWPSMRPGRGPLCSLAEHLQHRPGQVVRPRRQGWPLLHGRLDAVHLLHDLHLFDCLLLLLLLTCLGSLLRQQLGLLQSNLRLARDVILDVLGVPLVEEILLLAMISHAPLLGLGLLLLLLLGLRDALLHGLALGRSRLLGLRLLLLLLPELPDLLDRLLHDLDVLAGRRALREEGQPLLDLVAELLAEDRGGLVGEAVDARGQGALVGEVPGDAALVLLLRPADEGRVEDEAVLGRVALGLEGAEERLLRAQDLHRGGRVLGEVREAARVRDEPGAYDLPNERGEVRRHEVHLGLEVLVQGLPHGRQLDDLAGEVVDVLHVHLDDVLAHGHLHGLQDLRRDLLRATGLLQLRGALLLEAVAHADDPGDLRVRDVVRDDLRQLREVPCVPLADAHGEGVDVLVEVVEQRDGVDDGLVLAVRVQLHAVAAESMPKAKPCLGEIQLTEVLHEPVEVQAHSPQQLPHRLPVRDVELCAELLAQLGVVDAKTVLLLLLGQAHLEEVDEHLGGGPSGNRVHLVERLLRVLEGHPGVELHDLAEALAVEHGLLHLGLRLRGLLELALDEEGIAGGALEEEVQGHCDGDGACWRTPAHI
mmetsp:Transcript_87519/g.272233  ORF Transcript_87519/g.272233 Transcript_87519/m.272233 type:complete len:644 (+) Transcript_87519:79-2010(+)